MAFSDPIEASGALILPSLHSPNYVAGVSGWTINKDGSCEFNNIIARGSWIISTGGQYLQGYVDFVLGQGPTLRFHSPPNNDYVFSASNVLEMFATTGGAFANTHSELLLWPINGRIQFQSTVGGTPESVVFDPTTGFLMTTQTLGDLTMSPEWFNVSSFSNTWSNLGIQAGIPTTPMRLLLLPDGNVQIEGMLSVGASSLGTDVLITNVPAKYRPTFQKRIPCPDCSPVFSNGSAWIDVFPNGDISASAAGPGSTLSFCATYSIL